MNVNEPANDFLSRIIGSWTVSAKAEGQQVALGEYTNRWILNDQFVETTGSVKTADGSNDFEIRSIIGYLTERKIFRWWTFMSNGHFEESEGNWNSENQVMSRITRYGDVTQTATSDYTQPDVEKWIIVNRNELGEIVSEMKGTNTRRSTT